MNNFKRISVLFAIVAILGSSGCFWWSNEMDGSWLTDQGRARYHSLPKAPDMNGPS